MYALSRLAAPSILFVLAACGSGVGGGSTADAGGSITAQQACEDACNHVQAKGCAADVQAQPGRSCAETCAQGVGKLTAACAEAYIAEHECFARAPITCNQVESASTSLAAACNDEAQAELDCVHDAGAGGAGVGW